MKNKTKGFTLIELLIVIAIIAVLSAVVLFALGQANTKAKSSAIQAELSQLQKQAQIYVTYNGNYGMTTLNGGTPNIYPCAPDGSTSGSSWPYAIYNSGPAAWPNSMFGSTTAQGSLSTILNSIKSDSGWKGSYPTVFCIAANVNGGNPWGPASAWAIAVRDPSNQNNFFCADSAGNIKTEINPPAPQQVAPGQNGYGINYPSGGNVSCQ